MPNSGLTSATVGLLAIGPAIVYRGAVPIGTLAASATAEEVTETRQPRIAGLSTAIEGLDRVVSRTLRITGEFLEHSAAESAKWMNGGVVGGVTVTPPDAAVFLTSPDSDIRFEFVLGDGARFRAVMSKGIVTGYPFAGQDPGEGASTITWEARALVGSPDDAPYTYQVIGGDVSDAHLQLVTNLGGDAVVQAIYVTTDGITGLAHASVIHSAGVVDELRDYRGETGFGPKLVGTGTARPAWDAVDLEIVGDGVDDWMGTAASALFDLAGAKSVIVVGVIDTVNGQTAWLGDGAGGTDRAVGVAASSSLIKGAFYSALAEVLISSGVATGATVRVAFASKNGTTLGASEVPNQAQVTNAINAIGAGNNILTLFTYDDPGLTFSTHKIRAVIVLNRAYTATDKNFIRDWAVANLSAVVA